MIAATASSPVVDIGGPSYRDLILSRSPLHYWRFTEATGAVADLGSGNLPLTVSGTPTRSQDSAIAGSTDSAIKFDSDDDIAQTATPSTEGQSYAVECWFRIGPEQSGDGCLVGKWGDTDAKQKWLLEVLDGRPRFYQHTTSPAGNYTSIYPTKDFRDGKWHHIVAQRNATANVLQIYVDARWLGNATITGSSVPYGAGDPVGIGKATHPTVNYPLRGEVDEVAIYNRVLTEQEIGENHAAGRIATSYGREVLWENPWGYWPLDEWVVDTDPTNFKNHGSGTAALVVGQYARTARPALVPSLGQYAVETSFGDYILSSTDAVLAGTGVMTHEMWVEIPEGSTQFGALFYLGNSGANGYGIGIGNGSTFGTAGRILTMLRGGVAWTNTGYTLPDRRLRFHFATVRETTTQYRVYVNGTLVASPNVSSNSATGTLLVGSLQEGARYDDYVLYRSALSQARIQAHYNSGQGSAEAIAADAPYIWAKFGNEGRRFYDRSHWGYTGGNDMIPVGLTPTLRGQLGVEYADTASSYLISAGSLTQPTVASLEGWVYVPSLPLAAEVAMVNQDGTGSTGVTLSLGVATDGKPFFYTFNGSGVKLLAPAALTTGQWHHVVGTVGPAGQIVYVDGALAATNARTSASSLSTGRVYSHASGHMDLGAQGAARVAHLSYYPGVQLSAARVTARYNARGSLGLVA